MTVGERIHALLDNHPIMAAAIGASLFGFGWALDKALRSGRALNWALIRELVLSNAFALLVTAFAVERYDIGPMSAAVLCAVVNMVGAVWIDRLTEAAARRAEKIVGGDDGKF